LVSNPILLSLELTPASIEERVTVVNSWIPHLNLSSYDSVFIKATGSPNARILIRFILNDASTMDLVYWSDLFQLSNISLKPFSDFSLRGDAYISISSDDGNPVSVSIQEIAFVKIG
jgi:hypothetical protein